MIEDLHISCFRAINDSALALKSGLSVLIGPNGSGKSSLVEALRFLDTARLRKLGRFRS